MSLKRAQTVLDLSRQTTGTEVSASDEGGVAPSSSGENASQAVESNPPTDLEISDPRLYLMCEVFSRSVQQSMSGLTTNLSNLTDQIKLLSEGSRRGTSPSSCYQEGDGSRINTKSASHARYRADDTDFQVGTDAPHACYQAGAPGKPPPILKKVGGGSIPAGGESDASQQSGEDYADDQLSIHASDNESTLCLGRRPALPDL